jgi:hypothetical protein
MEAAASAIGNSVLGSFVREATWAYPLANLVHLLGMILLIGGIGLLDLRIVGAFRTLPLMLLSRALVPVGLTGLMLMLLSGPLLFAADAVALSRSSIFAWKLGLIALALSNAAIFRLCWDGRTEEPPVRLRIMAGLSLAFWLGAASLGRLIAYF